MGAAHFNIGMYAEVCEPVWFKHSLLIEIAELCSLMLVYMTLTLIQGHRGARKQKLLCWLSHKLKFLFNVDGFWRPVALVTALLILAYMIYI